MSKTISLKFHKKSSLTQFGFWFFKLTGEDGCGGKGGSGGQAAANGDVVEAEYIQVLYLFNFSSNILPKRSNCIAAAGQNGADGLNMENIEEPIQANSFRNSQIVKEYIKYLESQKQNHIQQSVLIDFSTKLDEYLVSSAFKAIKNMFE